MPKQIIRYEREQPETFFLPANLVKDILIYLPATSDLRRRLSAVYTAQVKDFQDRLPKKDPNPTKWPTRAERLAKLAESEKE